MSWQHFRKVATTEMRPYEPGEDLSAVSVSDEDTPCAGGWIARDANNHADQWYINPTYHGENYIPA